ncbi:discoidin domain-containing protein [Pseudoflavonifractor sp. An187]|uniref:discoidin domain-containing protein n=1 Tax=Pseudoflavonifractor sp. An187 TaxID=1965578 RepID=UPI000B389B67|nr:discoidin domain-containing protein [Pseudoflavonifractor sp. An187]OUP40459.1 hypothetical protein B5F22_11225 [Pseudoflavonifractor sp. An187]
MKKSLKRGLAALLAAVMLTSGLAASAAAQPKADNVNLARLDGVVATASDTETDKFPPSATIDGNYEDTSRWGTNNDGKGTTERWLQLDLGARYSIDSFKVFWEKTNIQDYTIETSTDGSEWTQQVVVTGAAAAREVEHQLENAVVARYVRLSVTKYGQSVSNWWNVGVREFEVYGNDEVVPVIGNLARLSGVTATASDTETDKFPPSATIDGNYDEASRWGTNNDGKGTTERWLQLNLGEERTITGFKVFWEKTNIQTYYIETSTNGTDWTQQVFVESADGTLEPEHQLAEAVTAQYVRLRVTQYGEAVSNWYNVGVREFEVYGHMPEDAGSDVVKLPEGTNIARQNGVIASATNVESGTSFTADKARDGDKTSKSSRWATDIGVKNPTITYNLGNTYMVGSVILYWESNNPDKWYVQTSMDGEQWTTQKTFEGKLTSGAPIQTVNFDAPVEARYVRVWVEKYSSTYWNNVAMYEFEVYQEESEIVVTPANTAETLAQSIQIQDGKVVMTGEVPEKYTATWGCNYEQVVDASGAIHTPLVDTTVEISVTVRDKNDTTTCGSATVELDIPGVNSANEGNAKPAVVPELAQWYSAADQKGLTYAITADSRIVADDTFASVAKELQADLKDLFGLTLPIVNDTPKAGDISLVYHDQAGFDKETYNMVVTDQVVIQANDATGAYWGTRSVLQALQLSGNLTIAQGTACDYPEFENRGFMLDVGRKPTSMETLKTISKTMAWYKMNSFHVHLSDNLIFMEDYVAAGKEAEAWNSYQGYRLEYSDDGLTSKDYYYTKAEFKDFMAYSRALSVDIIPELDVPAHALSITNYIKNTLGRPDLVLNKKGGNRPWFDHVDISKQDGIDIIKEIYDEYIDEDIFDENTIVHIGADEFYDSHPAYRNFLIQMIDYIENVKHRQVRVWGSLTSMNGGEGYKFGPEHVQGAQMNIWNTGWANPQQMFNLGFGLVNTIDGYLYMVPSGNGSVGGYGDWLNTQNLYNSWEPENMGGTMIPTGSTQMLGACYAIWNDNIDTRAAGINETDLYTRFVDALPYLGTKMWGTGGNGLDRDYATLKADVATLGAAPNTNPYHTIDLAEGTQEYAQYSFTDTQDRSGNDRDLTLNGASLTDGTLTLTGDSSYASTGLDVMGPKNTVSLRLFKASTSNSGEQIILEADAAYGETTVKAIANEDGTWKLGFARELYEYEFDYNLPCDEWVELTITNEGNKTYLLVDGEKIAAVGYFLPDENATTQFMGKTGITYSSFNIPVARIGSETNSFVGQVDDVMFYANGVTPTAKHQVTFNSMGGSAVEAVVVADGQTVAQPEAPVMEGYTFGGWYTDENCTTAYDFDAAVTADITLYAKWTANEPADTTLLKDIYDRAAAEDYSNLIDSAKAYYEQALADAKAILADPAAYTQAQVDEVTDRLLNAVWMLDWVKGNPKALQLLVDRANQMMDNADKYVSDNWQLLVDALADAEKILAEASDTMQGEMDEAADALLDAILAQRYKADKSILEELLNQAESMDLSSFTAESVAVFRTALQNAQAVMADETLTEDDQATVNAAVAALSDAMNGLTAGGAPETTDKPEASQKPENTDKPQATEKPEKVPQTGDSSLLLVYVAILASTVLLLSTAVVVRKQTRR